MFLTDARELGAREVAPDALLVKLPKKKRKIKKSNKIKKTNKNREKRKKILVDPGRHFPVPYYLLAFLKGARERGAHDDCQSPLPGQVGPGLTV